MCTTDEITTPRPLTGGTMMDELTWARRRVPELEAEVTQRDEQLAILGQALPIEHFVAQIRSEVALAESIDDFELAQIAALLDQALDVVEVNRRLMTQRLDELEAAL